MNRVIISIFVFLTVAILLFKQGMAIPEPALENYLESTVVYDADGLKDPFVPPKIEKKKVLSPERAPEPEIIEIVSPPSLIIQGIVWGGSLPQAIINQTIVKIGDTLGEARIIDIKKEGVTIVFQDQQFSFPAPAVNSNLNAPKIKQNPMGGRI